MGYNGWPIPLRLHGIMVVLFSKNKYPVQDNEYDYHDSLQVNLIEKKSLSEGSTKNCSGKSPYYMF